MAPIKFAKSIIAGQKIQIYNNGNHSRDFTYIDDIVSGIRLVADRVAVSDLGFNRALPSQGSSYVPWQVFNIGGENPIALMDFVSKLERALNRKANIEFVARQIGDMDKTSADCSAIRKATGWSPKVSLDQGLANLADWCESNLDLLG
jgi:UDP-glucuronate 4-epimerase